SKPAPQPAGRSAAPQSDNTFSRFARWAGFGGNEAKPETAQPAAVPTPRPASRPAAAAAIAPKKAQPEPHQEAAAEPPRVRTTAASGASLMSGATPLVQSDSFESRFGPVR
ncbi:MAG TPA: hypothetical protein VKB15_07930, partial [Xanthobacteraceae bacterium]|nr:hypothetical protein [Xanthobacteraceae bacterium]